VVERIYRMYADVAGLRYIAQELTDHRVPSPSQYDPARNRHRDPRGWSHSAIRAILDNPTYLGVRIWGREDEVTVRLDGWIATLADPEDLARDHEVRPAAGAGYAALQRHFSEANRKVAALVTAVESGVAVEDLTAALRRRAAERDELDARLERAERPCAMSAAQISELVEKLGGLSSVLGAATGAARAEVCASLGLRLDDDPHLRLVTATADVSRVAGCVLLAGSEEPARQHTIGSDVNASIHTARLSRVFQQAQSRAAREPAPAPLGSIACVRGGTCPPTTRVAILQLRR
jgi:hypothetical protein